MDSRSAHNTFNLSPLPGLSITVDSNFDSGNIESATSVCAQEPAKPHHDYEVRLQVSPAAEPFNPQYSSRQSQKCFFHFSVKSNQDALVQFVVKRMAILGMIQSSFDEYYRICVGTKAPGSPEPTYEKHKPQHMSLHKRGEEYELEFKYKLQAHEKVYFAYHFPYSCERLANYLQNLTERFQTQKKQEQRGSIGVKGIGVNQNHKIYFRNELLIESVQKRPVNLLTITQMPEQLNRFNANSLPRQQRISKSLFPYYDFEERPYKFKKPYVLVTCRVHPGETSSSYALEGFIDKLVGQTAEAEFLRRTFVFLFVPMVNPDGVFHGTYRMDMLGHNLNRFYNNCAPHRHPSIFAINALLQHHSEDLVAFFDLHSHPQTKGSFLYGNAYNSIEDQVESQVFARLLSLSSECFVYENCTFSEKNMNSKDINDILTKDGSGRVCAYRKMLGAGTSNGVHCYAIELGYHGSPLKKQPSRLEQLIPFKSVYRRTKQQFEIIDYRQNGAAIVLTLAQVYIKTVQSIRSHSLQQQQVAGEILSTFRDQIGKEVYERDDRFKNLDGGLLKKIRNIASLIEGNLYSRILKKFPQIEESVEEYLNKKNHKSHNKRSRASATEVRSGLKVVQSVELRSNRQFGTIDVKKTLPDEDPQEQRQFKARSSREAKLMLKIPKEKVNLTPIPLEFQLPPSNKKNRKSLQYQFYSGRIAEIPTEALPRIDNRKLKLISQIQKNRRRSPIQRQNVDELKASPAARGWLLRRMSQKKITIHHGIDDIVDLEKYINIENEDESDQYSKIFEQAAVAYDSSFNPELNNQMNRLRNQAMFQQHNHNRASKKQQQHQTARPGKQVLAVQERVRHSSRETQLKNMVNFKPVTQARSGDFNPKFGLELRMREKYEKEYQFDSNWRLKADQNT